METQGFSTTDLKKIPIALIGYGNQGRAHALNLRDSGFLVDLGLRPGKSWDQAVSEGWSPLPIEEACLKAQWVVFLIPDETIAAVYRSLLPTLKKKGTGIGFAHGFNYHYQCIEICSDLSYFMVGPRAAGVVVRSFYQEHKPLPGAYAVAGSRLMNKAQKKEFEDLVKQYAWGIGIKNPLKTTFEQETECDLFGEQAVLCGGLLELINRSFLTLESKGLDPRMAFLECCFEVKTIMDLILSKGPLALFEAISPTAFYGGRLYGKEFDSPKLSQLLEEIYENIHKGEFKEKWLEASKDSQQLGALRAQTKLDFKKLELAFRDSQSYINP